jgi:hypothetical protein
LDPSDSDRSVMRQGRAFDRTQVDVGVWTDPYVQQLLASRRIGAFLAHYRTVTGASLNDVATRIGRQQSYVCKISKPDSPRITDSLTLLTDIADALSMPDHNRMLIGLAPAQMRVTSAGLRTEDDWMERRDFLGAVAAITLGTSLDQAADEIPSVSRVPIRPPARIGMSDVTQIRNAAQIFRDWGERDGGGLHRAAVAGQLDAVVDLQRASMTPEVRTALCGATADLAEVCGYMFFDVQDNRTARATWMTALRFARQADDIGLQALVLNDLSYQAQHVGRVEEAYRLVTIAQAGTAHGRVPAGMLCELMTREAACHSAAGRLQPTLRATAEAETTLGGLAPEDIPPWLYKLDDAELAGGNGWSYLGVAGTNPNVLARATSEFERARAGHPPTRVRTKALDLGGLAIANFRLGEVDAAVATGNAALDLAADLASTRVLHRLEPMRASAARYLKEAQVVELLDRLNGQA